MSTNKSCRPKTFLAGFLVLFITGSACLSPFALGWWIDFSDEPVKSDIIVVLAGGYTRSPYAGELYAQGYAPDIWISQPKRSTALLKLDAIGVRLPTEESITRQILLKMKVPESRIHLYGRDVLSTADEALALRREFPFQDRKILVVTSRFHARRARLTFRRILPEADIRVTATPYESFTRRWWKDKELASNAILEVFKTAYFLTGGRMRQ